MKSIAISVALTLLLATAPGVIGQGTPPASRPAAPTAAPAVPAQAPAAPASSPAAQTPAPPVTALTDTGWPRVVTSGQTTLTVYQPQLDQWDGFRLNGRVAVAVAEGASQTPAYGVVQFSTQTHVDKDERMVSLEKFTITNANFPTRTDKARAWASLLEARASRFQRMALDRLEAAAALAEAQGRGRAVALKNDPPRIIFSNVPAMLIPIDGQPAYRDVPGTALTRILNMRPLILRDQAGKHYLKIFDGWMESASLTGEWTVATSVPADCTTALKLAISEKTADLLVGGSPEDATRPSLAKGAVPRIYVETGPAELIVTDGQPNFVPLEGLNLTYAENTTGNVFVEATTQAAYVLVSGRWFSGPPSLAGPWTFVDSGQLPASFARIPEDSPKENVKASIAGTPQAEEAVVANSIPQTAKVNRSSASFTPSFDGQPRIEPIEGTELQYVVNASAPIIVVGSTPEYYGVENGVWFVSSSLTGAWFVATRVPEVIYSIPASSSLHYVTYVRVYDHTQEYVVVGYTPGYYGTYVSSGTIVYGTGYLYSPWVGTYWYGPPVTYGFGVGVCYTPWAGWAMGFGFGWAWGGATVAVGWGWGAYPWWGPAAYPWRYSYPWVYSGAYGAAWGPRGAAVWGPGYWAGTTGNVYSRWGSRTAVTRTAGGYNAWTGNAWARQTGMSYNSRTGTLAAGQRAGVSNAYTGSYASARSGTAVSTRTGASVSGGAVTAGNVFTGREATAGRATITGPGGNSTTVGGVAGTSGGAVRVGDDIYAGRDGNVYRHQEGGGWQERSGNGWQNANSTNTTSLDRERTSRSTGNERYGNYRSGGYRSAGGGAARAGGGVRAGGGRRR